MAGNNVLGLDIGDERVGVALVRADVKLPVVVATLLRSDSDFWSQLVALTKQNDVGLIVLGLPRDINGQETTQTLAARQFAEDLGKYIDLPLHWQDEAVTSVKAEAELNAGRKPYQKGDIDALAACYILEDYLQTAGAGL